MRAKGGISYPLKSFALILRSVFGPLAPGKDKVTRVDEDSERSKVEVGGGSDACTVHVNQNTPRRKSPASMHEHSPQNALKVTLSIDWCTSLDGTANSQLSGTNKMERFVLFSCCFFGGSQTQRVYRRGAGVFSAPPGRQLLPQTQLGSKW